MQKHCGKLFEPSFAIHYGSICQHIRKISLLGNCLEILLIWLSLPLNKPLSLADSTLTVFVAEQGRCSFLKNYNCSNVCARMCLYIYCLELPGNCLQNNQQSS